MDNDQERFQRLKTRVETKQQELDKAEGRLQSVEEDAVKKFNTKNVKKLETKKKEYEEEQATIEEDLRALEKEINELLNEMDDQ